MSRFVISPSRVARYYFHECDRYLRYRCATRAQRRADGIPDYQVDHSLLTRAILEGGRAWEARLLERHLQGRAILPRKTGDVGERRHSLDETLAHLRSAPVGAAIYQATLQAPASFYETYGIDADTVTVAECFPDLLVIADGDDGVEVRVVDAKASEMMKLSHRIQVGLYSLILEHLLAERGIDTLGVSRVGGVWLYEQDEPEWFDLARIRGQLETFLAHDLTRIVQTPAGDAFWHLYYRCEWCDYYAHCRREAEDTDDVSRVPYLSTFAKRHLRESAAVRSVADFRSLLDRDDAEALLAGCASLEGRAHQLRLSVAALQDGTVLSRGAASVGMPKAEHVAVMLTVQSEPLEGRVYGYAINRVKGAQLFGDGRATIARVAPSGAPETLDALRRHLVRDLMDIMGTIHEHNVAHANDWNAQKTVQCYVFDSYERDLLTQMLLDAVLDAEIAPEALALLFYFQHPDLALADDHPATEVFFPLVVLTDVIRELMALPVSVVYRLADANAHLQPREFGFSYRPDDFFAFELSNRMKSNAIFEVWERGRGDLVENIEGELRRRVWATASVVNGLREQLAGTGALFAWPPKFFLPEGFGFRDPVLSRLAFIARYENVLEYLGKRSARARSREDRLASGTTVELELRDDFRWEADPDAIERAMLARDSFPRWIVTPDTDSGRMARLAFDDFAFRSRMYAPKRLDMALASIADVRADHLRLDLTPSPMFQPRIGERYALEERFTDWNGDRLVETLAELDGQRHWFSRLVTDPLGSRVELSVDAALAEDALNLGERFGMTESQLRAFAAVIDHDLQVVWGPPGTGKTHFLALAILCLAEAHRRAGRTCRAIVTAFTHTAIDNVLGKICQLQDDLGIYGAALPVVKLQRADAADRAFECMAPESAAGWAHTRDGVVLGSTVWQLRKVDKSFEADLVVVDEGSQLTVGEAAIALRRRRDGGRIVVAGDPEQLPPIVNGDYPLADGEPPLHRSILECLRFADPDATEGLVAPLLESFRMNDVLCAYPAATLYPDDYRPATPEIAATRLAISHPSSAPTVREGPEQRFVDGVLDPSYPLVVCVLENVHATRENPHEARLVADLAAALRDRSPDVDDRTFWRDRLFVVSPHHAHIRLIRRYLRDRLGSPHSFVDTVDKMQGQECDAVIVSYGVSDVEYALSEQEFIYSRNRLNVAMTRARTKSILLISRRLLQPPIQALERDDVADGIAYMQGLAFWCEQGGDPLTFELDGTTVTVLRRGG